MKIHAVHILLSVLCSVGGQNYLQCFKVRSKTTHILNENFQRVTKIETEKGKPMTAPIPISDVFQRINSTLLFGQKGYPPNVVCEYHFVIGRTNRVRFTKVHLDVRSGDPASGKVRLVDCDKASRLAFNDRDFISLNTNHRRKVFCGRPGRQIDRKVLRESLLGSDSELIVTFWSDASLSGDGFDGYFVNLRQRPTKPDCQDDCGRYLRMNNIGWVPVDIRMNEIAEPVMNGQKYNRSLLDVDDLIEWMVKQSVEIDLSYLWVGNQSTTGNVSDTLNGTVAAQSSVSLKRPTTSQPAEATTGTKDVPDTTPPPKRQPTVSDALNGTAATQLPVSLHRQTTSQPAEAPTGTTDVSDNTPLPQPRSPVSETSQQPSASDQQTTVASSANNTRSSSSPSLLSYDSTSVNHTNTTNGRQLSDIDDRDTVDS